jgi:hypothetical protein
VHARDHDAQWANDHEAAKSAKKKREEIKKISLSHFASSFALFAASRLVLQPKNIR